MKCIHVAIIGITALLSGCSTTPPSGKGSKASSDGGQSQLVSLNEDDKTLGAIDESRLPDSSCGMVLWTLDAQKPIAVFRYVSGAQGEIKLGNRTIKLTRIASDGANGFGVFERQSFESKDGLTAEVSAQFGLEFDGGSYLERGLIKLKDESGWSLIAPAAGIAGCRN